MPQFPGTLVIPKLASAPSSPTAGQIYYDTTVNAFFYYNGTAWVGFGGKAPTRQILTAASGTYTTPTGCVAILVECVGGGGGGGGCNVTTSGQVAVAGGGGGGAYSASLIQNPSATYAYQVGAGCAGGAAGANNGATPAAANDTTFGSTIVVAKAGSPGLGGNASTTSQTTDSGAGGVGSSGTGDIRLDGGGGGVGIASAPSIGIGGFGGSAGGPYGAARKGTPSLAASGSAGSGYGGGGA